jgi:S-formylglutathione hydrolase FrmB
MTEITAMCAGERPSRRRQMSILLRVLLAVVMLMAFGWTAPVGKADGTVQTLMVPSGAMDRDIPVTFVDGGPHAVYLLDAFDGGPDVSGWISSGNALSSLAGKGVSVVSPAGGAFSLYTNWEQDADKQWETFLSQELPAWLSENKGLAAGGHGVVGASQGGTAAMTLATFHPERFRFAASLSGFLTPSATASNGAITEGMHRFGGVDTLRMWGPPQLGRWKWHDPASHVQLLVDNDTRLWIFSPATLTCSDSAAMIGYCDQAQGSARSFYASYRSAGGRNAHFESPDGLQHDWTTWGSQLGAVADDFTSTMR